MEGSRFDRLIRGLLQGSAARREAIRLIAGAVLSLLATQQAEDAVARKCKKTKSKKGRRKCKKNARAHKGQDPNQPPGQGPDPGAGPDSRPTAVLLAAGDIADCDSDGDEATAALLDTLPGTIAALGDTVYEEGTPEEYRQCYEPSWGRHKARTRPAVGNHEYLTDGASGYFDYFGAAAGERDKGYYSYDLGAWHIVVLNSNCSQVAGCQKGSAQERWLREDLAAHPAACTLAYWHHPRYSFGNYSDDERTRDIWQALHEHGAEIVLAGHDHNYQRYAPQDADGRRDDARGIRQFVVGTGGKNNTEITKSPPPNVEAYNGDTDGVLKLTLRPDGYDWQFIPVPGQSFTDAGSGTCH